MWSACHVVFGMTFKLLEFVKDHFSVHVENSVNQNDDFINTLSKKLFLLV